MRRRILSILLIFAIMLAMMSVSARAAATDQETAKETTTHDMLAQSIPESEVAEPMFTDGFEKVTDNKAYVNDDGKLVGKNIWIQGKAFFYEANTGSLIVTNDTTAWVVNCGDKPTENFKKLMNSIVDKDIRVFGKFTGWTDYDAPGISFLYKDEYMTTPYRIETLDNKTRISYCDYAFETPKYDKERKIGSYTFKESSAYEVEEEQQMISYNLSKDTMAYMLIQCEDLSGDEYKALNQDQLHELFVGIMEGMYPNIVYKEDVEIGGRKFHISEITMDQNGITVAIYSYMAVIDGYYYFVAVSQPFFATESYKKLIPMALGIDTVK
ncbi:hypothetical protein [Butyrivibrio sp. AE3006]|uniref:hypothetical protein n=1 Tax=Butyrivibrio sp. AE3006 TaxID=1280673 RepID=UPI000418F657|nr:hypothetical protein [Butyrivibrio sp. AE3006]